MTRILSTALYSAHYHPTRICLALIAVLAVVVMQFPEAQL